jgi:DNA-directed RNA polymerase specialized sigma subunit
MAMGFHHRDTSRSPRKQQIRRLSFLLQRPVPEFGRE